MKKLLLDSILEELGIVTMSKLSLLEDPTRGSDEKKMTCLFLLFKKLHLLNKL